MRIGILSLPLHTNYGGILQAYALQKVLEDLGHDVNVINRIWIPRPSWKNLCKVLPLRFIRKYIRQEDIMLLPEQYYKAIQYEQRSRNTRNFIQSHINQKLIKGLRQLRNSDFDVIVVGSDQVLRPKYFAGWGDIKDAFLDFASEWDIKRVFYAASFGCEECEYTPQQILALKVLIRKFCAISCREYAGVGLFKNVFDVDASLVLDPTLLLSRENYLAILSEASSVYQRGILLNYILDDTKEKTSLVDQIAADKQLISYRINDTESLDSNGVQAPVETWLKAFSEAEFIVTDSFHACVFSVVFKKPFLCIANVDRGLSRFDLFSHQLGLSKNIITSTLDYDNRYDYTPPQKAYDILEQMKQTSIEYLKKNL